MFRTGRRARALKLWRNGFERHRGRLRGRAVEPVRRSSARARASGWDMPPLAEAEARRALGWPTSRKSRSHFAAKMKSLSVRAGCQPSVLGAGPASGSFQ